MARAAAALHTAGSKLDGIYANIKIVVAIIMITMSGSSGTFLGLRLSLEENLSRRAIASQNGDRWQRNRCFTPDPNADWGGRRVDMRPEGYVRDGLTGIAAVGGHDEVGLDAKEKQSCTSRTSVNKSKTQRP
jgi:hypothetical protein